MTKGPALTLLGHGTSEAKSSSSSLICILTPPPTCAGSFVGASRQQDSATPADFVMAEGEGWKLGYDRSPASASSYSALIGSEGFSFAITRQEYDDFIKVCTYICPLNAHMASAYAAYTRLHAEQQCHSH